jgi:hypothetical protein
MMKNFKVCSHHFSDDMFSNPSKRSTCHLLKDAYPSLTGPYSHHTGTEASNHLPTTDEISCLMNQPSLNSTNLQISIDHSGSSILGTIGHSLPPTSHISGYVGHFVNEHSYASSITHNRSDYTITVISSDVVASSSAVQVTLTDENVLINKPLGKTTINSKRKRKVMFVNGFLK